MLTCAFIVSTVGSLGGAPLFEKSWYWGMFTLICSAVIACIAACLMSNPKPRNTVRIDKDTIIKRELDDKLMNGLSSDNQKDA